MKSLAEFVRERNTPTTHEPLMEVKICQEIFLAKAIDVGIDKNFTLKGGVALYEMTDGGRGFTKDMDLDLISYSIEDKNILSFFQMVNQSSIYENIHLEIVGEPQILHHANYKGKSVDVLFRDTEGNTLNLSFDIGVHVSTSGTPMKYAFSTFLDEQEKTLMIFIDPPEQMIAEKCSGFIKFGARSTRTKDIFDIFWLMKNTQIDGDYFSIAFQNIVVTRNKLKNTSEAVNQLTRLFNLPSFQAKAGSIKNWLGIPVLTVIQEVVAFLKEFNQ